MGPVSVKTETLHHHVTRDIQPCREEAAGRTIAWRVSWMALREETDAAKEAGCCWCRAVHSAAGAVAAAPFGLQPLRDQSGSAADAGIDRYGGWRTIARTGAAFHAGVTIVQPGLPILQTKDTMRTDLHTAATAYAALTVELERCDIAKVSKALHRLFFSQAKRAQPHSNAAPSSPTAIIGRAILISLRTPEGEVNGVLPVKLKA